MSQPIATIDVDPNLPDSSFEVDSADPVVFSWRNFDPAHDLEGGSIAPLAIELVTYRDRLDELLNHAGEYVVIQGRSIAVYHPDRESAAAAAVAKFGPDPVLVKKVVEEEPVLRIGRVVV